MRAELKRMAAVEMLEVFMKFSKIEKIMLCGILFCLFATSEATSAQAETFTVSPKLSKEEYEQAKKNELAKQAAALSAPNLTVEDRQALLDDFKKRLRLLRQHYLEEQTSFVPFVGQGLINGTFVSTSDVGMPSLLTFTFIDPATGLPVVGPQIGSVLYEVRPDPFNFDLYVPLGRSFDASTNFAFLFTVTGIVTDVRVTPFDLSGNPIIIPGENGLNVAVGDAINLATNVPEPATILLLSTGLAGFAIKVRKRLGRRH